MRPKFRLNVRDVMNIQRAKMNRVSMITSSLTAMCCEHLDRLRLQTSGMTGLSWRMRWPQTHLMTASMLVRAKGAYGKRWSKSLHQKQGNKAYNVAGSRKVWS